MALYIIAKYHCEVAGVATETVDYQVRYFENASEADAIKSLASAAPEEYQNEDSETVRWIFDDIMATEENPSLIDGDELIGFVTQKPVEMD